METPKKETRIHSSKDFELCYLRHKYIRRVKNNPTVEDMIPYRRIVTNLSSRIFSSNTHLFYNVGMALDDIIAIGQIQLVSFLDLFRIDKDKNIHKYNEFLNIFKNKHKRNPVEKDILNKNKANFTIFLKQRMIDLIRICNQKQRNIKGLKVKYDIYYGIDKPPKNVSDISRNPQKYNYKKCEFNYYRSIRKHVNKKHGLAFQFAGCWYVPVPIKIAAIDMYDITTSKINPYDNIHNLNPEQIYFRQEEVKELENKFDRFENSTNEEKIKTILNFVEKNEDNPDYEEEISTAKKMIFKLEKAYVRGKRKSATIY